LQSLNTIHFKTGINAYIFGVFVDSVQKMTGKDRYCALMFAEMTIRAYIFFNQKFDSIEGFDGLGSQGRI
jgi:hypothetical protein